MTLSCRIFAKSTNYPQKLFTAAVAVIAIASQSQQAGLAKPIKSNCGLLTGSKLPVWRANCPLKVVMVVGSYRRLGQKVRVKYPVIVGRDKSLCKRLNNIIGRAMNENAYDDLVEMTFDQCFVDASSISTGFTYVRRGGVHTNSFYVPINYKLKPRVGPMTLADLSGGSVDFESLRKVCSKRVAAAMSRFAAPASEYYEAMVPVESTFKDFVFDKNSVTFTFCGLTCCAFGKQSFRIAYTDLPHFIQPGSPVAQYVKATVK